MLDKQSTFDITIDPTRVQTEYLKDLLRYRELFYFLAWRDVIVRYKQAFFGIAWAVIRPLLSMILFTMLFNRIAHLQSTNGVNYFLFVLAGMLPWQLYSNAIGETSNVLLNNAHLISKTYFPRMILPAAQIVVHFLDFLIGLVFLMILMIVMATLTGWTILALPLVIAHLVLLCLGTSLWLSAVTVQFRDVRFIVPFVIQFGAFLSPVGYSSDVISEKWQWIYGLNPLVGIIDAFRWTFFGVETPYLIYSMGVSLLITAVLLVSGFYYFRKTERLFADRI